MRKLVCLMLMVMLMAMCVSVASGETDKIQLVGMCWGSTAQYDEGAKAILDTNPELAEKYEVSWVLGGESDGAIAEKLRLALSSGEQLCDFTVLNYTQVPEFARAGALVDISEALTPYQSTMTTAAKTMSQYEGQTVAVPFEVKTKVWYYRSDIFEECGIVAEDVKNTDDLIAAGKKLQEKYPNSYIWNLGHSAAGYSFYLTLSGNGARYFDEEGNYNIASDPGTIAMLEDYKKMVDAGVIADISDWTPDWEQALADGTIVSQLSAGWLGQEIFLPTYSGPDNEWKVALWPEIAGTDSGSDAGGSVMVVPNFSAHPAEAAEYIGYACLSDAGSMINFKSNGSLPQNTNMLSSSDVVESGKDGYFGESYAKAQMAASDKFAIFNYSPNASLEQNIVVEYFTKAVNGDMSIAEALEAAQNDMNVMIINAFN